MAIMPSATPAMQQAQPAVRTQQGFMNPANGQMYNSTASPQDINSIVAGMVDRVPWREWDQYQNPLQSPVVQMSSQISMFQVPIGQPDPVTKVAKTKLNTSMAAAGLFNPPYCLVLMQIGFHIQSNDVKADIDKLINNYWMEFRILGKIFYQGKIWMFPDGYGLFGNPNPTGGAADQNWANGFPAPQAGWRLNAFPRYIPPLTQFQLTLISAPGATPPTMSSSFVMEAILDGLSDQPVQ